jgi:outer membrane protein assembly factor BamB
VVIRNTVINANVVLLRNGIAVGYGGATPGDLTLAIGANGVWNLGDKVTAVQYIANAVSPMSNSVTVDCVPEAVLTQHNNRHRTGAYLRETTFTAKAVGTRGMALRHTFDVDDAIFTQPLYVPGLVAGDNHAHDIAFVATLANSIYAFDVNSGTQLWKTTLRDMEECIFAATGRCYARGIGSTPVIDLQTGTIYLVYSTKNCQPLGCDGGGENGQVQTPGPARGRLLARRAGHP